jgi:hypothetical protein
MGYEPTGLFMFGNSAGIVGFLDIWEAYSRLESV